MPSAASITIKKNDGTTNVVYNLLAASGGDKSPAVWRCGSASGTGGQQPSMTMQSRNNGDNTARRMDMTFVFPSVYTDASSSLTQIRSKQIFNVTSVLPLDTGAADVLEGPAQFAHFLNDPLVISCLQSGYAAT